PCVRLRRARRRGRRPHGRDRHGVPPGSTPPTRGLRLGVDIGGTFTDLVAHDLERGETVVSKVPGQGVGPGRDVSAALGSASIPPEDVRQLTHGTTAVTNLLIERTG